MNFALPQDVIEILNILNHNGFSAYAVGGCVRDMFLNRIPQDWDITTAAPPEVILSSFPKTVPTGLEHGTVTVLMPNGQYEVTTFRVDGIYEDHRKPESVTFTDDITKDLSRRDFTMNAMAYHPETGLVDPFGGRDDIEKKLIRCVGNPLVRFDEDALRMLRAVRFSAQTGFTVHEDIVAAMKQLAPLLSAISAERIRDELMKTILSDRPEQIELLHETGLLSVFLPELDRCFSVSQKIKYHIYDVGHHSLKALEHTPKDPIIRLAALLHDIGKPDKKTTDEDGINHFKGHDLISADISDGILTRLRFDNKTREQVVKLIRFHDRRFVLTKKSIRRAIAAVGEELFPKLIDLQRADNYGQNPEFLTERLEHHEKVMTLFEEIIADGDALTVKNLAIGGNDLLAMGYQGKEIGDALAKALELVLDTPSQNEKKILLNFLKKTD